MDIILLERIEKLGTIGDVVTVKDGYARNFLLPQKKALRANEANKKVFEANRERLEKENAEKRVVAEGLGKKVEGAEVVLIRAASNAGQLYGSVNVRDMVAGLVEQGFEIDKRQIIMGAPIKSIGMHDVTVALHPEVHVTVKANVARSDDEAKLQSEGVDVLAQISKKSRRKSRNRPKRTASTPTLSRAKSPPNCSKNAQKTEKATPDRLGFNQRIQIGRVDRHDPRALFVTRPRKLCEAVFEIIRKQELGPLHDPNPHHSRTIATTLCGRGRDPA